MFVDRAAELAFLTTILTRTHPGPGQLIMLYGRRRVGKTALLRHWAEQSGAPFAYWVAAREPAPLQRRKLFTELLRTTGTNLPTPAFESWSDLWDAVATLVRDQRHLVILLSDPFLRFHFRFLEPYAQEGILSYQPERVLPAIQRDLRAFVGSTAWEELARQWIVTQRATDALGFTPEVVGSHWSRTVQIDVVAINWQTRDILLGECEWGADTVDRTTVRELISKTPLVLADLPNAGADWRVSYALFARAGATPAACQELAAHGGIVVDLARLHDDLTAATT